MTIHLDLAHLVYVLGTMIFAYIAYVLGKRAKLRELHRLQEQGLLEVKYTPREKRWDDPNVSDLLKEDPNEEDEDALDVLAYPRRDDEDRKVDWAKKIKEEEGSS